MCFCCRARVQSACEQVIHQIKSRAFYGCEFLCVAVLNFLYIEVQTFIIRVESCKTHVLLEEASAGICV